MSEGPRRARGLVTWSLLLAALAGLIALARRDRGSRPHPSLAIDRRTVRLEARTVAGGPAAEMRQAAAELEQAAAAADEARAGLEKTGRELERTREALEQQRRELEGLQADADANTAAAKRQLDESRAELEAKRGEMERAAREAEERVARARRDLERLQRERVAAAAQAGVAQGLGRGRAMDMQVAPDPRRVRNPAFPPVVPNQAAVAAAGTAGRGGAGGVAAGPATAPMPAVGTAAGDVLRGQAARIEAEGRYAVDTSTAAINAETARAMALDNRVRTVETFFEARRLNRINRAFEAGPAVTAEQAVRLAAMAAPPRPSSLELDSATGAITWPRLLNHADYADLTVRIQRHFHERAARGGSFDPVAADDCSAAFDALVERLRGNVARHPAGEHGRVRTFLDGLRREYDLPLDD